MVDTGTRNVYYVGMTKTDTNKNHEAKPQAGTRVDRSSYARPLAGEDAKCEVCGKDITTNPMLGRWAHR